MQQSVSHPAHGLNIGFLMQSGFHFGHNAGPQINAAALLKALDARGHNVTMLALAQERRIIALKHKQPEPETKLPGISGSRLFRFVEKSIRFPQSKLGLPYLGIFDSLRFREASLKYLSHCDIFHERYTPMSLGGTWAARHLKIPLIVEVHADVINLEMPLHDKPIQGWQHRIAEMSTRRCFAAATRIIVVSKPLGTRLETYWNVPVEKIVLLPNAVDLELFTPRTETHTTRARLGLGDAPVILFTGSFQPWHGVETLIQAFSHLLAAVPDARLLLVGDGHLRPTLEAQVHAAGLSTNVLFTGNVAHQEIPDLVAIADIAVAPYDRAQTELWFSPLKLFEYMALGKAIVASNVGQIAEVIQDGYSGMLIEPGNSTQLCTTLVTLLQHSVLRQELGTHARQAAIKNHSWTARAQRLEEVFCTALAEHTARYKCTVPAP